MNLVYDNFTEAYYDLLDLVYNDFDYECSPRDMTIRERIGVKFSITNPINRYPYLEGRNFSLSYCIAEMLWYLSGNNSTDWISYYSAFWKKISDDGTTANSAYGSRIFKTHPRILGNVPESYVDHWNQWDYVINELVKDNDSRRAVIHIRTPADSILARLDVPCTLSLQFLLRNNKVDLVVSMRSSDLILGLAYDVPAFTMFQELMANSLSKVLHRNIKVGTYHHISNSLHIYSKHYDMVQNILHNNINHKVIAKGMELEQCPVQYDIGYFESLNNIENMIRNCESELEMHNILSTIVCEKYFKQWFYVLAIHTMKKKGFDSKGLTRELSEQYRFFY